MNSVANDLFTVDVGVICVQALEQEYGCQLCIGPCTTRGEVRAASFCANGYSVST